MPFTFSAKVAGGGDIQLSGKAGPIHTEGVVLTPVDASLKVTHLDLTASGLMDELNKVGGTNAEKAVGLFQGLLNKKKKQ